MALSTKPYKGTRDFYPDDMRIHTWMYDQMKQVVKSYCYEEYSGPMLESFELYAAKTGEEIVNQQLYTLEDKSNRKLAVRPEMTPTMARMVAGQVLELPKPVRWFSFPNLWRYERPQRGRLREHWQLNVDLLGGDPAFADFEILNIAFKLISKFGGSDKIQVHVNNRKLINHFFIQTLGLTADQALKASKAVDAKAKIPHEVYKTQLLDAGVPEDQFEKLEEFFELNLDEMKKLYPCDGVNELTELFELFQDLDVQSQLIFDAKIMRGLDYYTGTVFEIYDTSPENNRAMFGGGRYDNLVGLFGKQQLSGVGFGMGDVTLQQFLETHDLLPKDLHEFVDVFITLPNSKFFKPSIDLTDRFQSLGLKVFTPLQTGKFATQLKLANKLNAHWAVIFGDDEFSNNEIVIKNLKSGEQKNISINELIKIKEV